MRFDIITVLPELLESPLGHSIMQRARDRGLLEVHLHQLRDFAKGKHRQVDDYQFGGGAGMVMKPEPLAACLEDLKSQHEYDEIIYLTPDGQRLDQALCNRLSLHQNLLVVCGHYKGIDERIRQQYVTLEVSIGDFVLSGGELAAAVMVDAIGRLLPGVLNDETSALFDSFQDDLLAPPVYTRPAEWLGLPVPEVLLSGHEGRIEEWRQEQSLERTRTRRPDLFEKYTRTLHRRLPAEWEPQSAVQLTFPHADSDWADTLDLVQPVFVEIAEAISRYEKVLVVCRDLPATRALLAGAKQENLRLVEADSNDTWARDHGAITLLEEGQPVLLDFVFNGWGLKFPADKDNLLTGRLFAKNAFRGSLRAGGLVLEGGGIESDGQGILLTTAECLLSPNRNPHLSKAQIETELKNLFGLSRVLWLNHGYLAGDDTDSHVDTLARFCDPYTIAYVQCTDPADEHFFTLQQMEAELQAFRRPDGEPYRLVPLPWPDACYAEDGHRLPATYANFLIINGAVLVPTYRVPQDEEALSIFKDIFPDRAIIGIDCRPLILQHGSLHCVTMQYPKGVVV